MPLWAGAQSPDSIARAEITAGSSAESRIIDRCAKRLGMPISVRPFGPRVLDSLLAACGYAKDGRLVPRAPMWGAMWVNTARAALVNEGPVWAGKGATVAASGGVVGSWRAVSYSVRPIAFWSQNLAYRPSRSIQRAPGDFSDPWFSAIDRPYRFGDAAYSRFDAGESFVRADSRWVAAGISTAAQMWGPARYQPLVLGNNAGGFPHMFVETGLPMNVGIGRIAARWIVGTLAASSFAPAHLGTTTRLAVGAVGSFTPRGFDGLELGAARFFHLYDTPVVRDMTSYTLPFSGVFKAGLGNLEAGARTYNQLGSIFVRLAPKTSEIEAYGEYLRDDHSVDLRDALVELDHNSAFMLGFRRSNVSAARKTTFTVELSNGRYSHLERVRAQAPSYTHTPILEGHTSRGLPLGAAALPGGGGLALIWERRTGTAAWAVSGSVLRQSQNTEGGSWNGTATGRYIVALQREFIRSTGRWSSELRVEPGFGDVASTNVGLAMRVTR